MTTSLQNQWAYQLEQATDEEIKSMAEYAIDHLDNPSHLRELLAYLITAMKDIGAF